MVPMNNILFWIVTPCSLKDRYQHPFWKMEAVPISVIIANIIPTTWYQIVWGSRSNYSEYTLRHMGWHRSV